MKASILTGLALLALEGFAFPTNMAAKDLSDDDLAKFTDLINKARQDTKRVVPRSNPGFDPAQQYISNTGDHAFVRSHPRMSAQRSNANCISCRLHRVLQIFEDLVLD
jgi:hypothetical protein